MRKSSMNSTKNSQQVQDEDHTYHLSLKIASCGYYLGPII
jgi:hypothetical protein